MKLSIPKKINISLIIVPLLLLIILLEGYISYSSVYKKLNPQSETVIPNKIIRVNRAQSAEVGNYLKSLEEFQIQNKDIHDPFQYAP